ncbi:hypothetical protein R1sor_025473 [Riccia sorocarpa]|uniref:Uncharacterized protein n=1 Tax=Riccia sorocarpa TaxID=122646 RepID=A0ABD3G8Q9_9MARC
MDVDPQRIEDVQADHHPPGAPGGQQGGQLFGPDPAPNQPCSPAAGRNAEADPRARDEAARQGILAAAQRLNRVARDMFGFGRQQFGIQPVSAAPVNVAAAVPRQMINDSITELEMLELFDEGASPPRDNIGRPPWEVDRPWPLRHTQGPHHDAVESYRNPLRKDIVHYTELPALNRISPYFRNYLGDGICGMICEM